MPKEGLNRPKADDSSQHNIAIPTVENNLAAELAQHGITSVPITFFDWGGYRYSNARDAIAAAKRNARK